MTERMWTLDEVKAIVASLSNGRLGAIYNDNFAELDSVVDEDPGLAYVEVKKLGSGENAH